MLLIILAACTIATADPQEASGANGQEAHRLLAKMKASRDLLKSGAYRASGRMLTNDDARDMGPLQGDVEIFSAFDYGKGLLRFDHTRPVIRQFAREAVPGQHASKYIRTPDLTITWITPWRHEDIVMQTAVGIHPPTLKTRPEVIFSFDVRSLGLILWDDLWAGIPFRSSFETWDKARSVEVVPEANGVYRLRLVLGQRSGTFVPQTLWLDEHQGFSPTRLSYSLASAQPGQPDWYNSDCRVRWREEAGVWVPASFRIERRMRGRLIAFDTLRFEWDSVNKPIWPELFTPEGLGVPVGTHVFDYRTRPPRRLGVVKAGHPPK